MAEDGLYELVKLEVSGGFGVKPRAEVQLRLPDGTVADPRVCMDGVGMIDCAIRAVNFVVAEDHRPKLGSFFARSKATKTNEGSAAHGICDLTLHGRLDTVPGESKDPDVVVAAVRAYIDGLNRLLVKAQKRELVSV